MDRVAGRSSSSPDLGRYPGGPGSAPGATPPPALGRSAARSSGPTGRAGEPGGVSRCSAGCRRRRRLGNRTAGGHERGEDMADRSSSGAGRDQFAAHREAALRRSWAGPWRGRWDRPRACRSPRHEQQFPGPPHVRDEHQADRWTTLAPACLRRGGGPLEVRGRTRRLVQGHDGVRPGEWAASSASGSRVTSSRSTW